MHRHTQPSTFSTVLNEYLREFDSKLEVNLQHQARLAAGDGTSREKAATFKEAEWLRKLMMELSDYEHNLLYPLATQKVASGLEDGALFNLLPFHKTRAKIPQERKSALKLARGPGQAKHSIPRMVFDGQRDDPTDQEDR